MIQVTVYDKGLNKQIMEAVKGETLMQLLGRYDVFFDANCGGSGRCRQCEVLVDGVRRRACQYLAKENCKVVLPFSFADKMQVVLEDDGEDYNQALVQELVDSQTNRRNQRQTAQNYICVDLGTTTIGMALVDRSHRVKAQYGCANSQRSYGADVGDRIRYASTTEGLHRLQQLVLSDIKKGKKELCRTAGLPDDEKMDIYVSGNTTMLHILGGHSPESIGRYPFIPEHSQAQLIIVPQLGTMHLLPCASGYIGSDVTVGAFYYHLHHKERPTLYIDLGTNGEMLLGDRNHILSASVAAGPAFEQFLRGADALCALADMRRRGIIDEQGVLSDPYFEHGYHYSNRTIAQNGGQSEQIELVITQDMIRELQLAKGAVRAGIELLSKRFGCSTDEIDHIYVAGGFGFFLKEEDAIALKMFPTCFAGKLNVIGNASLHGNIACHDLLSELVHFNDSILAIDLAREAEFQEYYISYMNF